jgi:hypothetical protein
LSSAWRIGAVLALLFALALTGPLGLLRAMVVGLHLRGARHAPC